MKGKINNMKYSVQAKNRITKNYDHIGDSDNEYVDPFWIAGRINYLNMFENGNYDHTDVRVVAKQ